MDINVDDAIEQSAAAEIDTSKVKVTVNTETQKNLATAKGTLEAVDAGLTGAESELAAAQGNIEKLEAGANTLSDGSSKLTSGAGEFRTAVGKLNGFATMAGELSDAVDTLHKGSSGLVAKNDTLNNGAAALTAGTNSLFSSAISSGVSRVMLMLKAA